MKVKVAKNELRDILGFQDKRRTYVSAINEVKLVLVKMADTYPQQ